MAYTPDKIRNVMLGGHSGAGKTSLTEALLFLTKSSDRLGTVLDGNTVSDFDPEEIKRKASISTAVAPYDDGDVHVNLIDAPGLFDFELGLYEAVMAAETVMTVVSARDGAVVGTDKSFKIAKRNNKAKLFFISKMAAENADFGKTLDILRNDYGSSVCPLVVPVLEEGKPTVYIDLLNNKAYTYDKGKAAEVAVPENVVDVYMHELNEAVAETDEELLEKFIMEEPFTHDELVKGLRAGMRAGSVAPVLCGDSEKLEGLDLLIATIRNILPAPSDIDGVPATNKAGEDVTIKCDSAGKLAAYIFKTVADPFVGKLSYVKVLSGVLRSDAQLYNPRVDEQEKPGKLVSLKGKKQTDIKELVAGDIGAITKLSAAKTGDTLCDPSNVVTIKNLKFPHPSLSMSIKPKKKGDESKVTDAIQRLIDEDPTLAYRVDPETKQQLISGLGEQHLDATLNKMKSKFGVEVELATPRVAYRETIRAKAEAEGKHKKQSGGAGQYGVVQMRFEPLADGDFEFVNAVVGGAVPKEFIPAVEKGLREAMQQGVLAGYPMTGVKATLYDGKYHPVDSKEVAFKSAARLAYRAACAAAKPAILEPIMLLKAYVPDSNTGDIMGEVTKRRGRVLGMNPAEDGLQLVEAEIPESEMHDFTTYIRSSTQGRGSFSMEFLRYEPLPGNLEEKVIADAKELREAEE